jgi:uncharacterized membrane protein
MKTGNFKRAAASPKKRSIIFFSVPIYLLLLLILLDAFVAPFLESRRLAISADFYAALRPVCHQWPTRCLWIFGSNTALCTRCLGIFTALFLTGLFFGIKPPNRIFWKSAILMNIPALVDGYTQLKGWRMSNNYLRLITGLLAGVGAGAFLFPLYFKLVAGLAGRFRRIVICRPEGEKGSEGFCFNKNSKEEVKR